jgi:uncharacterized protein (DUF2249 family)
LCPRGNGSELYFLNDKNLEQAMLIHKNVKIDAIIRHNAAALEAIISISPRFEKLRNPILRKLIGSRTTIAQASVIGKCTPEDFFNTLQPLGFEIATEVATAFQQTTASLSFKGNIRPEQVITFDVRPVLANGADPLKQIMGRIKALQPGQALKIIADFEPTPLVSLLKKQGYEAYISRTGDEVVETLFFKENDKAFEEPEYETPNAEDWDTLMTKYKDKLQTIDVRTMEMGQPMHTILALLEEMNDDEALFVNHERIPVFLIPVLKESGYDIRIKENSDSDIHLLIFKK